MNMFMRKYCCQLIKISYILYIKDNHHMLEFFLYTKDGFDIHIFSNRKWVLTIHMFGTGKYLSRLSLKELFLIQIYS